MKRLLSLTVALSACDNWQDLSDIATCRARNCDGGRGGGGGAAGGGFAAGGGGMAGGASGGGVPMAGGMGGGGQAGGGAAGGGSAGGSAGGGGAGGGSGGAGEMPGLLCAGPDAGAVVCIYRSFEDEEAISVVGEQSTAVLVSRPVLGGASHLLAISPLDGGTATRQVLTPGATGAHAQGGRAVVCGGQLGGTNSFVQWFDPLTGAPGSSATVAPQFRPTTCNVYPTDAGWAFAAWGGDAGALWVSSERENGSVISANVGIATCSTGNLEPARIRYSPFGGDGIVTGRYLGSCQIGGHPLIDAGQPNGFIMRAPSMTPTPGTLAPSNGPPVSEAHQGDHYVAWRGMNGVTIGRLTPGSNDPVASVTLSGGTREIAEVVSAGDAGMLVVGTVRDGGINEPRDLTIYTMAARSLVWNREYVLAAPGDQLPVAAAWLSEAQLVAVAGTCRPVPDAGVVPSPLCLGGRPNAFVVFLDVTKL